MKNTLKTFLAVASIAAASSASAVMIDGDIGINLGVGSSVDVDTVANTVSFTGPATVNFAVDDYAGLAGSSATYVDLTYDSFVGPQLLWSIVGTPTTFFTLTSITSIVETGSGSVTLQGLGIASIAGFDDTAGFWSFSSDTVGGASINFSSTTAVPVPPTLVPDAGATLALLGLGLVGLVGFSRRFGK